MLVQMNHNKKSGFKLPPISNLTDEIDDLNFKKNPPPLVLPPFQQVLQANGVSNMMSQPVLGSSPTQQHNHLLPARSQLICECCGSESTPEWRRGPTGARTLCNACGLYYAKVLKRKGKHEADIEMSKKKQAKQSKRLNESQFGGAGGGSASSTPSNSNLYNYSSAYHHQHSQPYQPYQSQSPNYQSSDREFYDRQYEDRHYDQHYPYNNNHNHRS